MFAAEARGELPEGTAKEWAHETPDIKKLPERKHPKKEKDQDMVGIVERRKRAEEKAIRFFRKRASQMKTGDLSSRLYKVAEAIENGNTVGTALEAAGIHFRRANRIKVAKIISNFEG